MVKKIIKRFSSDQADSLVSAIFILPVIFFMLITTVDMGIYMANRGQIQAVARDGARTIAIMGGNGTNSSQTTLMNAYGQNRSETCENVTQNPAYKASMTVTECNVLISLDNSTGLTNVTINNVSCNPPVATAVGQKVSCEIKWQYGGIPGSAMTFVRNGGSYDKDEALRGEQTTTGSAESEVQLSEGDLR